MNYLTLENASLRYGEKLFFDDIKLYINKGQKIALVAKNGTGKTTLLKMIMNDVVPDGDQYKLYIRQDIKMAYLPQEPILDQQRTVMEEIYATNDPKVQAIYGYEKSLLTKDETQMTVAAQEVDQLQAWDMHGQIAEILYRLKIDQLDQIISSLSGGQAKRVALAKIIISQPDFLILDEPTNHLDITMIEWLETYLKSGQLTLFMVTHDRYFLENVCDQIVELDQGHLHTYPGNYSEYLTRKAERKQNESVVVAKARKLMTSELDWMRKQPKARGTKAKARIDKFFETQDVANSAVDDAVMSIDIETTRLGSKIVELQYVSKQFDDLVILKDFAYKFKKGERVGIVGPNGVGKTTFVRILLGELKPDQGKVVIGETVKIGYYHQEGLQLSEDKRVIDVVRDIAEYLPGKKGTKISAEKLLEHFLFERPKQQVYVSQLSGGERRRLHLLQVLMGNPNFLILDEPTNDLDIITLNVLEEYLSSFEGCLIIVTHDRYFLDKIVDHLFILEGEGKVKDYNGSYDEYRANKSISSNSDTSEKTKIKPTDNKDDYMQQKEAKKALRKIEKQIENLEADKQKIMEWFNAGQTDLDETAQNSARLKQIEEELEGLEEEWMAMVD